MQTQCSPAEMGFGSSGGRKLVGAFDGGAITSNGGAVLLAGADRRIGLSSRLTACFRDLRDGTRITHTITDLLRQRVYGLALGHEDLIDHDALRHDPALTAVLDKPGDALAGKSTLNRLEHASKIGFDRHHKFDHDPAAIERLFVDVFLDTKQNARPRCASRLISMRRMIRSTVSRKASIFMATTIAIAIYRSTFSAAGTCSPPSFGRRAWMAPTVPRKKLRASSPTSASAGRKPRSCCAATAVFVATT